MGLLILQGRTPPAGVHGEVRVNGEEKGADAAQFI